MQKHKTIAADARIVTDSHLRLALRRHVDPQARGTGPGTALVAAVRDHLAPHWTRRILLATADAHGVYEKVGFTPLQEPG